MEVKFSICLSWRLLMGGGTAPLFHKFCITWGESRASPLDKKFGGFQMRYGYYREEKQSCSCWKLSNISTVLLLVVTIQTMLYRSSCGRNTEYAILFVFWSQWRLCYTVCVLVTIPPMLYLSSCGHNTAYAIPFVLWSQTAYAIPFVLWSQYRLCYTFRLVVTIPPML